MRYIISKRAIAILFGIISLSFYSGDTYAKCLTKEAPSRPLVVNINVDSCNLLRHIIGMSMSVLENPMILHMIIQ